MVQRRRGLRLYCKPLAFLGIGRDVMREKLDCNARLELRVLGLVHHARAAFAEFGEDFIVKMVLPIIAYLSGFLSLAWRETVAFRSLRRQHYRECRPAF